MYPAIDRGKRNLLAIGTALLAGVTACSRASASASPDDIEQPARASDEAFIERAFEMRKRALQLGDQGYGAVLVRDGLIVAQSPSRVVTANDPSAHAEMETIRQAARNLGSRDLSGCTLYSSTAACPMCEAAAYWAGIERQVAGRGMTDGGRPRLCG